MSLEKKIEIAKFDINFKTMCVSIRKDLIVYENDIEISRNSHRCVFCPGEIEKVKEYIGKQDGPEIAYLESMWTQQVIDDYNAMIAAQEE